MVLSALNQGHGDQQAEYHGYQPENAAEEIADQRNQLHQSEKDGEKDQHDNEGDREQWRNRLGAVVSRT